MTPKMHEQIMQNFLQYSHMTFSNYKTSTTAQLGLDPKIETQTKHNPNITTGKVSKVKTSYSTRPPSDGWLYHMKVNSICAFLQSYYALAV